jgi:hypothetical protein
MVSLCLLGRKEDMLLLIMKEYQVEIHLWKLLVEKIDFQRTTIKLEKTSIVSRNQRMT